MHSIACHRQLRRCSRCCRSESAHESCTSVCAMPRRWLSPTVADFVVHLRRLMRLRRCLRSGGDRDLRPARIERLAKRLDKTLRRAGHQRQLHVVPVRAHGVIDHGPSLHGRVAVGLARKDNPVGRLPNRHFADVADPELRAVPGQRIERQMAQAGRMRSARAAQDSDQTVLEDSRRAGARSSAGVSSSRALRPTSATMRQIELVDRRGAVCRCRSSPCAPQST